MYPDETPQEKGLIERIAVALERIADRLDSWNSIDHSYGALDIRVLDSGSIDHKEQWP